MNYLDYESLSFGEDLKDNKTLDIEIIKEISKKSCEE
jgi:hypothetical protein